MRGTNQVERTRDFEEVLGGKFKHFILGDLKAWKRLIDI